jgi:hypothetical protein
VRSPLNRKKESRYNSREDAKLLAEILPRPIYNRENNKEQPNFEAIYIRKTSERGKQGIEEK